jgi:5-methylcytosine-specific restriction endonuclease McrA
MEGVYALLPGRPHFDESRFRLGRLCKRKHDWIGSGQSLRRINGNCCIDCERDRNGLRADYRRERYERNIDEERRKARERAAALRQDPVMREILNKRTVDCYLRNGRASRSKRNPSPEKVPYGSLGAARRQRAEDRRAAEAERKARAKARREARQAERQTPEWKEDQAALRRIRYALNESIRLYNREKSKRRKAMIKERHYVKVSPLAIRTRYEEFGGKCAYCGAAGEMQMDHFVPLAKGGTHALGNLVPACPSCNYSKSDHDAETWYRSMSYFSAKRWRKISRVLGIKKGSPNQLTLI